MLSKKMCLVRSEAMAFRSQAGMISRKLDFSPFPWLLEGEMGVVLGLPS